jgi:hypothetical protein
MKHKTYAVVVTLLLILFVANGFASADQKRFEKKYEVTITNLTRGQIFSPPIVISHNWNFRLFNLGEEANQELAALAEDGDLGPITELIDTQYPNSDYAMAGGAVEPGNSVTVEIDTSRGLGLISVAGMLVTTNDAFFAVRDVRTPLTGRVIVEAEAYDAGSEANSENCDFIPGPPCGNPNSRDTDGAEGYVYIHAGIHGVENSSLNPAEHDWRNPVAQIKIRRIY